MIIKYFLLFQAGNIERTKKMNLPDIEYTEWIFHACQKPASSINVLILTVKSIICNVKANF